MSLLPLLYTLPAPDNRQSRIRLLRRSLLSAITPTKGARTPADSSTIRSYVGALVDVASWKLVFVSLLTVCVTLTESVGLLLLVPLLQVVGLDLGGGAVGRICRVHNFDLRRRGRPTDADPHTRALRTGHQRSSLRDELASRRLHRHRT